MIGTCGTIVQVNISAGGVPKCPVAAAAAGMLGLEGDKHIFRLHGGRYKALLLMASEVVDTLAAEGFSVYYGALGENLTTRDLDHKAWEPGQRFKVGDVVLELTEPRVPCRKLNPYGASIQKRIFSRFSNDHAGESGFYASVLQAGFIRAGDRISRL